MVLTNFSIGTAANSSASFTIDSSSHVQMTDATGSFGVRSTGELVFKLEGDSFDSQPIIDASAIEKQVLDPVNNPGVYNLAFDPGAKIVLDTRGLTFRSEDPVTAVLMTYQSGSLPEGYEDVALELIGSSYQTVGGLVWNADKLTVDLLYIPEPACYAGLVGLLALLAIVKRRR